jgi:hypothetical protein
MKRTLLTFLVFTVAALTNGNAGNDLGATNLTLTVDGTTYSNVTFGVATATSVNFRHSTGAASVPLAKLPPELQQQFGHGSNTFNDASTNRTASADASAELMRLKSRFESGLAAIDKDETARLTAARQEYLQVVTNLQKEATNRGDLDLVLVAKAERVRLGKQDASADFTGPTPQPLWNAKMVYWEACTNAIGRASTLRTAIAKSYVDTFAELKVTLTKQENLEAAILANQQETLARDVSSKPAGQLPKPVASDAQNSATAPASSKEIGARKSRMVAAGAGRIGIAAFNVAGSPFGEYDKAVIRSVQSRWYALISQNGLYDRSGTVTLHFNLMQDGSVRDISIKEDTAGEILGMFCQKAVVDSAPFPPLPEKLRMLIGDDPREVNFTFYY